MVFSFGLGCATYVSLEVKKHCSSLGARPGMLRKEGTGKQCAEHGRSWGLCARFPSDTWAMLPVERGLQHF